MVADYGADLRLERGEHFLGFPPVGGLSRQAKFNAAWPGVDPDRGVPGGEKGAHQFINLCFGQSEHLERSRDDDGCVDRSAELLPDLSLPHPLHLSCGSGHGEEYPVLTLYPPAGGASPGIRDCPCRRDQCRLLEVPFRHLVAEPGE
ncbi:MAG: hypothetical protein DDT26_02370 [Dehalococcoidia bacterium]|nr:hypothetical protein [Chloroflexota bacterium]